MSAIPDGADATVSCCRTAAEQPTRHLSDHAPLNELLGQQLKMRLRLQVELRIRLFLSEEAAYSGHQSKNPGSHGYFCASKRKTRPITPEIRSQFSVSTASCFRPCRVIE